MKESNINSRSLLIDVIRGGTIILMIFFHFCFDLNNFGFIEIDILRGPFWYFLPRLIVFLFLLAVGMSLALVHWPDIKWSLFWKRFLKITFCALIISAATRVMFPENWIYFGTLHAIATISLMTLPFLKWPRLSLLVALLLFVPSFFNYNLPWFQLDHQSWDYIAPFPWLGASLLGVFAVHMKAHRISMKETKAHQFLQFLGKHSLFIYLIHQPILFGSVYLLRLVIK